MADNETSYLPIGTCLEQIEKAVYGREVRKAIHDGIAQCYDDTVEGVNAAQQAASDTQDVIDNAVAATNRANTAATEASNVKVEQVVSGDTVTFTTTKRDGSTVSTSFQKPNVVVSKDEGSGEFSVTAKGWNGEEIVAKIPDPSEEVKSRATIAAVSKVKTALGNPLTITDGMDAPAVKTVVTLEPKQDLHGYDHPWVGGSRKNLLPPLKTGGIANGVQMANGSNGGIIATGTCTRSGGRLIPAAQTDVFTLKAGTYITSCTSESSTPLQLVIMSASNPSTYYIGSQNTAITLDEDVEVIAGYNCTQDTVCDGKPQYFQLELSSTATSYEPYSNICPIEGYDTVRVTATGKNLYDASLVVIGKNWLNGTAANRAAFAIQTVKGSTLNVMAAQNGDTHRVVIVGANKFGSNAQQSFNKNFQPSIAEIQHTVTADEYVIVQFERLDGGAITQEDIDCWDIAISYTDINTTSLSVAQAAGATVYGGTVTLNEDGSGTLVVDRATVTLQNITSESCAYSTTTHTFYVSPNVAPGMKIQPHTDAFTGVSDRYKPYPGTPTWDKVTEPVIGFGAAQNFRFTIPGLTEVADALPYINGTQVAYYLATPTTYNLTASQLRTLTGKNYVWTDGTKLELTYRADKYADVEKFLNAIPTGTKTGDQAVFADGADDLPFEKLTIAVEPHQEGSGDPSPDNIRPITGWDEVKVTRCGGNLLDISDQENDLIMILPAGEYTIKRFNSSTDTQINSRIELLVDGAYKYIQTGEYDNGNIVVKSGDLGWGTSPKQIIVTKKDYILRLLATTKKALTLHNATLMMTRGTDIPTSYIEYNGALTTLPISLKYATGSTVYGGTVTINRDGTGSVVVDRAMVTFDGDENWNIADSAKAQFVPVSTAFPGANKNAYEKVICSHLKMRSDMQSSNLSVGEACYNAAGTNWLVNIGFTSAADLKAYLVSSPMTVVYPLATPITYTLTAPQLTSLLGNNTVWCDAGQVTVKYKRDIGKALDAMVASLIEAGLYVDMGGVVVVPGA